MKYKKMLGVLLGLVLCTNSFSLYASTTINSNLQIKSHTKQLSGVEFAYQYKFSFDDEAIYYNDNGSIFKCNPDGSGKEVFVQYGSNVVTTPELDYIFYTYDGVVFAKNKVTKDVSVITDYAQRQIPIISAYKDTVVITIQMEAGFIIGGDSFPNSQFFKIGNDLKRIDITSKFNYFGHDIIPLPNGEYFYLNSSLYMTKDNGNTHIELTPNTSKKNPNDHPGTTSSIATLATYGDKIYYVETAPSFKLEEQNSKLYEINLDGSDKKVILEDVGKHLFQDVAETHVRDIAKEKPAYDKNKEYFVFDYSDTELQITEKYIYFTCEKWDYEKAIYGNDVYYHCNSMDAIYRVDKNGQNLELVLKVEGDDMMSSIDMFQATDTYLYYWINQLNPEYQSPISWMFGGEKPKDLSYTRVPSKLSTLYQIEW